MPTAWADRLDARGYHKASVTRGDTSARWDGATRTAEDGFIEGDTIVAFDPEDESKQLVLSKGDAVYLSGARKGQPAEIGLVTSLFQCPKGHFWLECIWFWRPERLKLGEDVDWHEKELFLQTGADPDENSVSAIELTKVVVSKLSNPNVIDAGISDAPHQFFQRRTYNVDEQTISELPASTQGATPMEQDPPNGNVPPPPAPKAKRGYATELKERVAALEAERAGFASQIAALNSELAARISEHDAQIQALTDQWQGDILMARISSLEQTMETKLAETAAKIMEETAESKLEALLKRVKELELAA